MDGHTFSTLHIRLSIARCDDRRSPPPPNARRFVKSDSVRDSEGSARRERRPRALTCARTLQVARGRMRLKSTYRNKFAHRALRVRLAGVAFCCSCNTMQRNNICCNGNQDRVTNERTEIHCKQLCCAHESICTRICTTSSHVPLPPPPPAALRGSERARVGQVNV